MPLPRTFQFSATSLQDYVDCHRRFQLRYLLQIAWPAPEAEPIGERERHGRLARDFHRLAHQHLLGLPPDILAASVHDPDLLRWWQAYLAYRETLANGQVIPEVGLSVPLAGHRLLAQYDALVVRDTLLAGEPERQAGVPESGPSFLILDWKTYRKRPPAAWLRGRLQSRVYPFVLVQAGASLVSQHPSEDFHPGVAPGAVQMCYWLAEFPQDPEFFAYDEAAYQSDWSYLASLVAEIADRSSGTTWSEPGMHFASVEAWPLTTDLRLCRFCNYRSLCERGDVAGPFAEYLAHEEDRVIDEIGLDVDLDWGQVQEIVY